MVTTKPIKVDDEVKKTLDDMKKYPRETYNDTLRRVLELNNVKKKK
jgi:predicted CopG family antitoxin